MLSCTILPRNCFVTKITTWAYFNGTRMSLGHNFHYWLHWNWPFWQLMVPGWKLHQNDKISVLALLWLSNLCQIDCLPNSFFHNNSKKKKKGPAMQRALPCHDVTMRGNYASCCRHVVSARQTPGMGGTLNQATNVGSVKKGIIKQTTLQQDSEDVT